MDGRIIWAKWRVLDDGRVQLIVTRRAGEEYRRDRLEYASIDEAAAELGASFRDVVERVQAAGRRQGRWRP